MTQHYRPDRAQVFFRTPDVQESDFELVCALRRAMESEVADVLERFSHVSREAVRGSLLELTVDPHHANTALIAARMLKEGSVVRRATAVILQSPYLSDELKASVREAAPKIGIPRVGLIGAGKKKVRATNGPLKR